jgi:hypothetical protein
VNECLHSVECDRLTCMRRAWDRVSTHKTCKQNICGHLPSGEQSGRFRGRLAHGADTIRPCAADRLLHKDGPTRLSSLRRLGSAGACRGGRAGSTMRRRVLRGWQLSPLLGRTRLRCAGRHGVCRHLLRPVQEATLRSTSRGLNASHIDARASFNY